MATAVPVLEEQVPIPVDLLAKVKQQLDLAEQVANQASTIGITVVKVLAAATQVGMQAAQAEEQVQETLRQILATSGVKPGEFKGFDWEKGVIKKQAAPTTVEKELIR